MKYLAYYTDRKFQTFSLDQQIKALDKLIGVLEQNLANPESRIQIIEHILNLRALIEMPIPEDLQFFLKELNPRLSPHQLLNKIFFYRQGALRKDSQMAIPTREGKNTIDWEIRQKAKQITVICDNLRSVFNVGSLFRTSECLGIGKIMLCGITPTPEHSNMPKTAMGTEKIVAWSYFSNTSEAIASCHQEGLFIYALETVDKAKSVFEAAYQFPLAVVIGNEALGIESSILELCDEFITLPQLGWKTSLNVGVAAGITLYQILWGGHNG
ncbi:MAG TPA: RNA methyltransferase [Candidatus Cloacimonas sp.]|nr:RNA methyltransferase [Candidatus Cloacimonas sp.]